MDKEPEKEGFIQKAARRSQFLHQAAILIIIVCVVISLAKSL
jgi:hypothetical protein